MDETIEDLVAAQLDAPTTSRSDNSPTQASNPSKTTPASTDATRVQNNLKARKRTKTGCLTCRRRRIKCGEERPTCANCIKSKRSCEGYAPRLTFKDPLSAFHPGWPARGTGVPYPNISTHNGAAGQFTRPQLASGSQSQFPVIAPRPMPQHNQHGLYMPSDGGASGWNGANYGHPQAGMSVAPQTSTALPRNTGQVYQQPENGSGVQMQARYDAGSASGAMQIDPQAQNSYRSQGIGGVANINTDLNNTTSTSQTSQWLQNSVAQELASKQNASSYPAPHNTEPQTTLISPIHASPSPVAPNQSSTLHASPTQNSKQQDFPHQSNQTLEQQQQNGPPDKRSPVSAPPPNPYPTPPFGASIPKWSPEAESGADMQIGPAANNTVNEQWQQSPQVARAPGHIEDYFPTTGINNQASLAVDDLEVDDDYYDVESDEEVAMMDHDETVDARAPNDDVTLMLALSKSKDDKAMRSYHQYLHRPDILTNYTPRFAASPLMDATTARIFCHFITVTGPGLSIYERHPVNPSIIFTGAQVPKSQRSLWTYTLPVLALSHPCLLQAMLALASLQIARLQQAPMTVPMKHYHYALVKIGKAVSTPSKRTHIATIAATLILAHFEATTAEHAKWSSHLAGARQLLMEVDFKGITRKIKDDRSRAVENTGLNGFNNTWANNNFHPYDDMPYIPTPDGLDENLVSQIMGWRIKYDQYGSVLDDGPSEPRPPLTEKDIDTYQVHRDLFWWYCKQDIIQSVISGKPLLLPYDRWVHCPPRAPIGRVDAIYGTMDHLSLLLGRIADFASRDQIRKKKVMQANGGHWIPPPGMFPGGRPGGAPAGGPPPKPPPPAFYGMVPDTGTARMPDAFTRAPRDQIYTPPSPVEDMELNSATADAEVEWREIQNALDIFEESLGPAWQPLSPDTQPPIATPFGTAMQYRTYHMTSIWSSFYTGRIIAARTHPSMPPAAMMAAAVAAPQTAQWANMIGRIVFGLQLPPENQGLNPTRQQ